MEFTDLGQIRGEAGNAGAQKTVALAPMSGGRRCKRMQVSFWVQSSGGTAPKLGIKVQCGPNGIVAKDHTTIAATVIPADNLYVWDITDATAAIGEYIHITLLFEGTATGDWVMGRLYVMKKPF
ncbi:MAG: hypothetical protein ACOZNI_37670 [Myxococcota bacterium]